MRINILNFFYLFLILIFSSYVFSQSQVSPVLTNYWGTKMETKTFFQPSSIDELSRVIKTNFKNSKKYRVVGSLHSDNMSAYSKQMMINLNKLPRIKIFDKKNNTFTVSSQISLIDANKFLFQYGRVLHGTPSVGYQSIGGSIATGSHSEGKTPLLSDSIIKLKVILPSGVIKTLESPDQIYLHSVSLGLLGTILEVTLKTYPLTKYTISYNYLKFKELKKEKISSWFKNSDRLLIDFFPYHDTFRIGVWKTLAPDSKKNLKGYEDTSKAQNEPLNSFDKALAHFLYKISKWTNFNINIFDWYIKKELNKKIGKTEKFISSLSPLILLNNYPNPKNGEFWWMEVLTNLSIDAHDFEFSVPLDSLIPTLTYLRAQLIQSKQLENLYHAEPILIRIGRKSSKTLLGMNSNQDTAFIILTIPKTKKNHFKTIISHTINNFGARLHLGKYIFDFKGNTLFKNYKSVDRNLFFKYRKEIDPQSLLINDFAKNLNIP